MANQHREFYAIAQFIQLLLRLLNNFVQEKDNKNYLIAFSVFQLPQESCVAEFEAWANDQHHAEKTLD